MSARTTGAGRLESPGGIRDHEHGRGLTSVERADASIKHVPRLTHVMGCDCDDCGTTFSMVVASYSIVVRVAEDRKVQHGPQPSKAQTLGMCQKGARRPHRLPWGKTSHASLPSAGY